MLTLQHRLRQMRVYELDHAHYCAALGRCECRDIETRVFVRTPVAGLKVVEKKAPPVLTLLARETRKGLPNAVLEAPSIVDAINRGDIRHVK